MVNFSTRLIKKERLGICPVNRVEQKKHDQYVVCPSVYLSVCDVQAR